MIILISDIQTLYVSSPLYKESNQLPLDVVEKGLTEVCVRSSKLAGEGEDIHIIHGGDLFERNVPFAQTITRFNSLFHKLSTQFPKVKFYTTTGNHDQRKKYPFTWDSSLDKQEYPTTYLTALSQKNYNFTIVDSTSPKGKVIEGINFHTPPYFLNENHFLSYLDDVIKANQDTEVYQVLVMHQDINPIIPESKIVANDSRFEFFDHIYFGHIHNRPNVGKRFTAMGSLFHMKGGDALGENAFDKGFWVLDPDNGCQSELHLLEGYPRFRDLGIGEDIPKEWEGDYIMRRKPVVALEDISTEVVNTHTLEGKTDLVEDYCETSGLDKKAENFLKDILAELKIENEQDVCNIKLTGIEIEGIQSIVKPISLALDRHPLTFYLGKKGSGKSTALLYAPYWAWTGKHFSGRGTNDSFITKTSLRKVDGHKWRGSRVILHVEKDGKVFALARHEKFKGETYGHEGKSNFLVFNKTESGEYELCDLKYLTNWDGSSHSEKTLNTQLWWDYTNITPDIFKSLVMFDVYSTNLIGASDSERTRMFKSMLQLDWVDEFSEIVKTRLQDKKSQLDQLNKDLFKLTSELQSAEHSVTSYTDATQQMVDHNKEEIEVLMYDLDQYNEEFRSLCEEVDALIKDKPTFSGNIEEVESEISRLNTEGKLVKKSLEKIESDIALKEYHDKTKLSTVDRIEKLEAELKKEKSRKSEFNFILDLSKRLISLDEKITEVSGEIEKLKLFKNSLGDISDDRLKLDNLSRRVSHLEVSSKEAEAFCPTCGNPMKEELAQERKAERQDELKKAKKEFKTLQKEITLYEEKVSDCENKLVPLLDLYEELEEERYEVNRKLGEGKTERAEYLKGIQILGGTLESLKEELNTSEEVSDEVSKLDLDQLREDKKRFSSTYDDLVSKVHTLSDSILGYKHALETWESDRRVLDVNVDNARYNVSKTEEKLDNQNASFKAYMESREDGLNKLIDVSIDLSERHSTLTKTIELDSQYLTSIEDAVKKVRGSSGIAAYATKSKLEIINRLAERYGDCVNQSVNIDLKMRDSGSMTYDVKLRAEGLEVQNLSGGQTALANMIFMFALSDYYNQTVAKMNLMMLDEPIKPVSDEGEIGMIYDLLHLKSEEVKLHVIAHPTDTYLSEGITVNFVKPRLKSTEIN